MIGACSGFVDGRIAGQQEFGLGLAVAIFVDATIVLVPSLMAVVGHWNYWLPKRLARVARIDASAPRRRPRPFCYVENAAPKTTPPEAKARLFPCYSTGGAVAMTSIRSSTETQGAAQAATTDAPKQGGDCSRCLRRKRPAELVARVARATSWHLRELSALPRTSTDHFEARLARVPIDK